MTFFQPFQFREIIREIMQCIRGLKGAFSCQPRAGAGKSFGLFEGEFSRRNSQLRHLWGESDGGISRALRGKNSAPRPVDGRVSGVLGPADLDSTGLDLPPGRA